MECLWRKFIDRLEFLRILLNIFFTISNRLKLRSAFCFASFFKKALKCSFKADKVNGKVVELSKTSYFLRTRANQFDFNQFHPIKSVHKNVANEQFAACFCLTKLKNRRPRWRKVSEKLANVTNERASRKMSHVILFAKPFDHFSWRSEELRIQ